MRHVVHWDGGSFFASIEQASDRRLRGRPVAVDAAYLDLTGAPALSRCAGRESA
jgi:nucleotidyltransferase/DNA polymerase involved in DNA repair